MKIVLDDEDLKHMPQVLLAELIGYLASKGSKDTKEAANYIHRNISDTQSLNISNAKIADLDPGMALKFVSGCSEKTKAVLASIVRQGSNFEIEIIGQDIDVPADSMRAVWAAITKRTRTITGDSNAILIDWFGDAEYNIEGRYVNQQGRVTRKTYESLARALEIDLIT